MNETATSTLGILKLFDSHCHLDDRCYRKDFNDMLSRARAAGVVACMVVGITPESSQIAANLADQYEGLYASVGIHPHDAAHCSEVAIETLRNIAGRTEKVRAWGETGLDFNRMFSPQADQEKWFIRQINEAMALDLPLIFHERDTSGRFLDILHSEAAGGLKGVVHCFSGNRKELYAYLDMGLYIGITGVLTIKGRGKALRELVTDIPADRLLIETDAPYLTPTPDRNRVKRNEPAFVKTVFEKLAAVKNQPQAQLAKTLWGNTCRLFGIDL
ncbi:MAG: TatD family hydrolase [Thermodesulfobacteriota bacterium]|nr:TatD family hydrolase [Thermodesulfobacteriota bacterium]